MTTQEMLRELMENQKWNQSDASEHLRLSQGTISNLLAGQGTTAKTHEMIYAEYLRIVKGLSDAEIRTRLDAESASERPGKGRIAALRRSIKMSDASRGMLRAEVRRERAARKEAETKADYWQGKARELYVAAHPMEYALWRRGGWDSLQYVSMMDIGMYREKLSGEQQARFDALSVDDQKYQVAKSLSLQKSKEAAIRQGWLAPDAKSFDVLNDAHVLLGSAEGDACPALAQKFGLDYDEPGSMYDLLSWRRVDAETVIGLIGDDRGWTPHVFVIVAYAPEFLCKLYDDDGSLALL